MNQSTVSLAKNVFVILENFGSLFLPGPKWNRESVRFKNNSRSSHNYSIWKNAVLKRDKHTCVSCGSEDDLQVDHIKPFSLYPELRFALDNGRTLCLKCHRKTSSYGGKVKKWKRN